MSRLDVRTDCPDCGRQMTVKVNYGRRWWCVHCEVKRMTGVYESRLGALPTAPYFACLNCGAPRSANGCSYCGTP